MVVRRMMDSRSGRRLKEAIAYCSPLGRAAKPALRASSTKKMPSNARQNKLPIIKTIKCMHYGKT
jgi:hypothetical protein